MRISGFTDLKQNKSEEEASEEHIRNNRRIRKGESAPSTAPEQNIEMKQHQQDNTPDILNQEGIEDTEISVEGVEESSSKASRGKKSGKILDSGEVHKTSMPASVEEGSTSSKEDIIIHDDMDEVSS